MKTISIVVHDKKLKNNNLFNKFPNFNYLKEKNRCQVEVNTSDLSPKADVLIIYNGYYFPIIQTLKAYTHNPDVISIYLHTDTEVVLPFNKSKNLLRLSKYIDIIITYKDDLLNNTNIVKHHIGNVYQDAFVEKLDFTQKKRLVMIQSNKFSTSKLETYSFRKRIIKHYNNIEEKFDLYGIGWAKSKNYRGITSNSLNEKFSILKNYKFAFAIENNISERGYFGEKALDCLHCGVLPVYLGTPNIEEYLPDYSYIDLRKFNSLDDLDLYLNNISEDDYKIRMKKVHNFLTHSKSYNKKDSDLSELVLSIINHEMSKKKTRKVTFLSFILWQNFKVFLNYISLKLIILMDSLSIKLINLIRK